MTIDKVKAIAKEKYGKELTDEQAAAYMEKHGKLSDDELDNISGGGCDHETRRFCTKCDTEMWFDQKVFAWKCDACGYRTDQGW